MTNNCTNINTTSHLKSLN